MDDKTKEKIEALYRGTLYNRNAAGELKLPRVAELYGGTGIRRIVRRHQWHDLYKKFVVAK